MAEKSRYWVGVLYNENMREDWKESIGSLVQVAYAYCVHDKDTLSDSVEDRKIHTHVILVFNNTTTYNHALSVFKELNAEGKNAINTCKRIISIRQMYEYLIHNTDECRKKNKHQYSKEERILGNNFDIGAYEQLNVNEKLEIKKELANLIAQKGFLNFYDMYSYVGLEMENQYFQVFTENQGFFANLIRGYYNKIKFAMTGEELQIKAFLGHINEE